MNWLSKVLALSLLVSAAYSFQCSKLFKPKECSEYAKVQSSLNNIIGKSDQFLTKTLVDINTKVLKMIEKILMGLKGTKLENKVIQVDNSTTITISGNMTVKDAVKVIEELLTDLKSMRDLNLGGTEQLEMMNKMITDILKKVFDTRGNAYLIIDKIDLQKLREYVESLLPGPLLSIVRSTIIRIIEKHHNRLKKVGSIIRPILNLAGQADVYDKIAAKIREIIEKTKGIISGQYSMIVRPELQQVKDSLVSFIDGVDQKSPIVKRGLKDLWSKVQEALDNLGDNIKASTKELVNKYKPKVLESLKKLKKVVLEGAREIALEIQGDIIKIVTSNINNA